MVTFLWTASTASFLFSIKCSSLLLYMDPVRESAAGINSHYVFCTRLELHFNILVVVEWIAELCKMMIEAHQNFVSLCPQIMTHIALRILAQAAQFTDLMISTAAHVYSHRVVYSTAVGTTCMRVLGSSLQRQKLSIKFGFLDRSST